MSWQFPFISLLISSQIPVRGLRNMLDPLAADTKTWTGTPFKDEAIDSTFDLKAWTAFSEVSLDWLLMTTTLYPSRCSELMLSRCGFSSPCPFQLIEGSQIFKIAKAKITSRSPFSLPSPQSPVPIHPPPPKQPSNLITHKIINAKKIPQSPNFHTGCWKAVKVSIPTTPDFVHCSGFVEEPPVLGVFGKDIARLGPN